MKWLHGTEMQIKLAAIFIILFYTEYQDIVGRGNQLSLLFGYIGIIGFYVVWLLSVISLIALAFMPNNCFKIFFIVIFFILTVLGVSYTKISGSYLSYDSFYSLVENTEFAGNALYQYSNELFYSIIISSMSFTFLFNTSKNTRRTCYYKIILLPIIIIITIAMVRGGGGVRSFPMQYRILAYLPIAGYNYIFPNKNIRNRIKYYPDKKNNRPDVILIIEESLRGDYVDINVNRWITPYLLRKKDEIINFGFSSSGANCSAQSNQILRFGPDVNRFESTFKTNPYIWSYAKKAGYRTVMIEGQAAKGMLNNRIEKEELKEIDDFIYPEGSSAFDKDMSIANMIYNITSYKEERKPVFAIAVKSGLHFPYDRIHPKIKEREIAEGDLSEKEKLVNSYKDAIRHMIDPFFKIILEGKQYKDSIIIYTSDHGQNILDNGHRITHCSSNDISPYEGLVPLFIITDNEKYRPIFVKASQTNCNKASHFNIYPTILTIMGYYENDITQLHGFSLFNKISSQRRFVSAVLSASATGINDKAIWNYIPSDMISPGCLE